MKTKDQSKLPVWPAMLLSTGALLYSAVSLAAPPAADAQAQARALLSPPVQHGAVAKPSDSVARTAPSAIPVGDAQLQAQQLFLARVR
ncbi:MAG TPA: hypothetical protein VKP66_00090, partial [Steroidobacteraceae bacterium]|nr:hypothetical protein [Steroidobacteraceae bacterium]